MIVIFSNENDLSTIDVAKRLKQMKQDVIIIEPDTAENMLIGIDNEKICLKIFVQVEFLIFSMLRLPGGEEVG